MANVGRLQAPLPHIGDSGGIGRTLGDPIGGRSCELSRRLCRKGFGVKLLLRRLEVHCRHGQIKKRANHQSTQQQTLASRRALKPHLQLSDRGANRLNNDAVGGQRRVSTFLAAEYQQPLIDRSDPLGYSKVPV